MTKYVKEKLQEEVQEILASVETTEVPKDTANEVVRLMTHIAVESFKGDDMASIVKHSVIGMDTAFWYAGEMVKAIEDQNDDALQTLRGFSNAVSGVVGRVLAESVMRSLVHEELICMALTNYEKFIQEVVHKMVDKVADAYQVVQSRKRDDSNPMYFTEPPHILQ